MRAPAEDTSDNRSRPDRRPVCARLWQAIMHSWAADTGARRAQEPGRARADRISKGSKLTR
jgi:hypothetical protein